MFYFNVTRRTTTPLPPSGNSRNEDTSLELMKIPDSFMSTTNQLIREKSGNTAMSFIYLPRPPSSKSNNGDDQVTQSAQQARFLELLKLLTDNLPPTVLVHGIHAVTSTAL